MARAATQVLALNGSLRAGSYNGRLLEAARAALPPHVELTAWSGIGALPLYNEDIDTEPALTPVRRLRDDIAAADALLIATPEYNATVPGTLKNAIDWASRPYPDSALAGKPAAVIGASTGLFGAVWAQAELRKGSGRRGRRSSTSTCRSVGPPRPSAPTAACGPMRGTSGWWRSWRRCSR